ncbi:MAG TPA: hypothetical protein DHV30_17230 [Balneola sp.]|nr:hypothetical protein [Balneola sp.]|tara:strand:- start:25 stop:210 length:186 start_codon:yes stop_codon:yes gene_type:complete
MDNVVYLDEFLLRRDLAEVRETLQRARYLVSIGIEVPESTLEDLQIWELELEDKLEKLILD